MICIWKNLVAEKAIPILKSWWNREIRTWLRWWNGNRNRKRIDNYAVNEKYGKRDSLQKISIKIKTRIKFSKETEKKNRILAIRLVQSWHLVNQKESIRVKWMSNSYGIIIYLWERNCSFEFLFAPLYLTLQWPCILLPVSARLLACFSFNTTSSTTGARLIQARPFKKS